MDWNTTSNADQVQYDPADVFAAGLTLHHIANTAYPIAHLSTMRPYRIPRSAVQSFASFAWQDINQFGLYVHVPFCEARCGFCEYTVLDPSTNEYSEDLYFDLLHTEFDLYRQEVDTAKKTLVGFDIGGGTPSLAKTIHIARVVEDAWHCFQLPGDIAISIETTPKIAAQQPSKMQDYHDMGIHRISMGVQTINVRLLQESGRTGTSIAYNQRAAENIRHAGFQRFNVDVMYGFAHQSLSSLEATLSHVIALDPDYITLYRTRYKGTRIAAQAQFVSLDEVNKQYTLAKTILLSAGYLGTPGKNTFSRHPGDVGTSEYLTERVINGTPYLGLGLGAQSLSQHTLSYNSGAADKRLDHYHKQIQAGELPIQDLYHLSLPAAMGKMISVSFYFGEVNLPAFQSKFGLSLEQSFPEEVAYVIANGLMKYTYIDSGQPLTLRLTEAGVRSYNGVIALFYAGAVKRHLLDMASQQAASGSFPIPVFSGEKAHG